MRLEFEEALNVLVPGFLPIHILLVIDDEAPIDGLDSGGKLGLRRFVLLEFVLDGLADCQRRTVLVEEDKILRNLLDILLDEVNILFGADQFLHLPLLVLPQVVVEIE